MALEADVSDAASIESLVAEIVEDFGRLDVLVNNAGIEKAQPLLEVDEATWDRTLAVDLKGPFLCLQAAARRMKEEGGGSIVNISSVHEDLPFPSYTPYAVAKGGLRMLMRNAAVELAPFGIRVNNIAPGAIRHGFYVLRRRGHDPARGAALTIRGVWLAIRRRA